jgi:hypothetical protein
LANWPGSRRNCCPVVETCRAALLAKVEKNRVRADQWVVIEHDQALSESPQEEAENGNLKAVQIEIARAVDEEGRSTIAQTLQDIVGQRHPVAEILRAHRVFRGDVATRAKLAAGVFAVGMHRQVVLQKTLAFVRKINELLGAEWAQELPRDRHARRLRAYRDPDP